MSGPLGLFAALLWLAGSDTPAPAGSWASLSPAERGQALAEIAARPLPERLLEVSRRFLGTPYVVSPLGEGSGKDPDPTLRYDAVDCLTFVEEVIALALAADTAQVEPTLRALRYLREQTYEDRNHLMEAQWLPHNLAKGFLYDVTARYGGARTRKETKTLDAQAWSSVSSRALELPPARQVRGTFIMEVIPLDELPARAGAIPSGTVLVVVREDRPFKVTRVSHLGFVVRQGSRTYLRHASRSLQRRVVDEDLRSFLQRNVQYQKWPVVGVSLYEVRSPLSESAAAQQP